MTRLVDQDARDVAVKGVDRTVVVDAGAGSGKTKILVDRICELVGAGVPIRRIAAVTFTESAAAELRDKVRAELAAEHPHAVADLDAAAIGTLHSFARRILAEHPVEAGLPPVLEILDEVASTVRINRWWSTVRGQLLADEDLAEAVRILLDLGVSVSSWSPWGPSLERLALRMQADWDLVEDLLAPLPPPDLPEVDLAPCLQILDDLAIRMQECTDPEDRLLLRLAEFMAWREALESAEEIGDQLDVWGSMPGFKVGNCGKAPNWPDIASVRARVGDLGEVDVVGPVRDAALRQVINYLTQQIMLAADERRREGQLLYHDLLVLARRVLRQNADVRAQLRQRYPHLLLDEFQDTDPIQVELAVRIAAGAEGGAQDWRDCLVPDGSVFVVGDPKQSIYRFRRADISTFMEAADFLGRDATAKLSTNFRSHAKVLEWVNHVFGTLIQYEHGVQPAYIELAPSPTREHPIDQPRVVLVRDADAGKEVEAAQVVAVIATALAEKWPLDGHAIQPSDITVLVPTRSHLPELESALVAAGVPYRLLARSLIYGSEQVRDLLLVAGAADDPANELLLAEALRTPILRCGDDDLWRWRHTGGSWQVWRDAPDGLPEDDPVGPAMRFLDRLHKDLRTLAPSEVLAQIVSEYDLLGLAAAHPDPPEIWRRYRIVIDQARQWAETAHGSMRDYLSWARTRAEGEDRENEIVLPEQDADDVSVMTIHAAKGLQFPMVVVTGLTQRANSKPGVLVWDEDGVEVSLGKSNVTADWDSACAAETERLEQEDRRLLYVACTRAEEYLVVSGCGPEASRGGHLRGAAAGADQEIWVDRQTVLPPRHPGAVAPPAAGWLERHQRMKESSRIRQAVSAGAIAHGEVPVPAGLELANLPPGLDKAARDLEKPAWLKGRYGTAIGRAVHATLQTVDLATGDGLAGAARAQALAEGVEDRADLVVALARSGFAASATREAAGHPHQKETYVGTVASGQVVEGFIDLLYTDESGGLVVIDYKTDAEPSEQMIGEYHKQLAVYAAALGDATGLTVTRRVLVFCREGDAVEVEV